jgi:cellulose biosynthesis protein BcsQ
MPTVVACYALKGGVGKTAAAVNLAWLAARDGHRTLLWDLDPQAAATFLLRSKAKVKGGTRKLLQGKSDVRDVVKETLYDGLGLLPAEALYDSADLDLGETKRSDERVERVLRPLADSYDLIILDCPPGLSLLSTNIVNAARLLLVPLVPSPLSLRTLDHVVELAAATATVPASAVVERMGQRRAPVEVFAPHSPAAAAFHALWMELAARLGLSATALATVES